MTNGKICIEWAMCLTFMILLELTIVIDIFGGHLGGRRNKFYEWTRPFQRQNDSAGGTNHSYQPQSTSRHLPPNMNASNAESAGMPDYNTPAAGPPAIQELGQDSEDLEKASALLEKKIDGGATPVPSSESDVESSPAASLHPPSPPSLARLAMTRTNGLKR